MGRTSASHKASGGSDSHAGGRPSNEPGFRRPSGANADGAPTLRNLVPWRDMEKKLAERLAAKAAAGELSGELEKGSLGVEARPPSSKPPPWKSNDVEPAPDSGVRTSTEPARELTYSVYTLEDLEARQARSTRMSMAFVPTPAPQPSRWADVGKSGLALVRAWWTCVRAPKPRPRVMDVCRVPLTAFLTDLKVALSALPWKKLAVYAGVTLGAVVLLLGLVLTAAELTDDLKPRRSSSTSAMTTSEAVLSLPGATLAPPAAVKPVVTTPSAPLPAEPASIEIDDDAPPPAKKAGAKPAAARPTKKPAPAKKKVELFNP